MGGWREEEWGRRGGAEGGKGGKGEYEVKYVRILKLKGGVLLELGVGRVGVEGGRGGGE